MRSDLGSKGIPVATRRVQCRQRGREQEPSRPLPPGEQLPGVLLLARALPATLNQPLAPPPAQGVPERRSGLCSQRALKVTHPQRVCSITGPPLPGAGFSSCRVQLLLNGGHRRAGSGHSHPGLRGAAGCFLSKNFPRASCWRYAKEKRVHSTPPNLQTLCREVKKQKTGSLP